jgi:Na+/melibiose symporter-like transporter
MQAGAYLGNIWGGCIRWYSTWRGDEILGVQEFALYSSLVMIVCYWLFVVLVKEPPLTKEQSADLRKHKGELRAYLVRHLAGLRESLAHALTYKPFLILFLSQFMYQIGVLAGIWMYTFLLEDWFGKTWSTPFAEAYLVGPLTLLRDAFFLYIFFAIGCGVVFLPFWNWIGKHFEKRTCLMIGILGIGCTYGASYLLFAPKSFPLLIV